MLEENKDEILKLENQLCFPLYACSKEVVRIYKPFLDKLDLTYTQYLTMMVMWEHKEINSKLLGNYLYLDSGTLTPLLKKLEVKGYITRTRAQEDERNLVVRLTLEGEKLKDDAIKVPEELGRSLQMDKDDVKNLYTLLYKVLGKISELNYKAK
ncbi:transcriptional regulator, MarR family [Arcobacter nitrofigilis DSM 7299]|uniref:HTH-type transcriptional regulator SarZ n=1 Tax=Arcobacter nitrofigilis (strain ATCC 33309 / DSM 7299 / CCUG 15893 / LMG 7604 / NCTC 12251 / CI) TaxID=572480 RepID=D5V173_ARCNC|nr:MarR family transcriptional regulator [Arcobacter nitrofigilis]ADG94035.1 transcriptional regulator, MarR family [Arcobacter nitrofigilis DSM 7299]